MSRSEVEQSDMFKGYGYLEVVTTLLGTDQGRTVIIKGGMHPRMKLLTHLNSTAIANGAGPVGAYSFATSRLAGTGAHLTIEHNDGRDAGVCGGLDAIHASMPFAPGATNVDDDIFEADEDVILFASTAAGAAADAALIVAKFEVLGE